MTVRPLRFSIMGFGEGVFDHGAFDALLERHVVPGADGVNRVDYARWRATKADRAALWDYLRALQAARPASLTRDEQFVFWVNLYNAETLRLVVDARPVKSVLWIRPGLLSIGPWKARTLRVDGTALSLDDIENRILRPGFADPRVHYALNCASTGCPSLRPRAWRATGLDADLDAAARAMINRPRAVSVKDGRLVLSRMFKWYRRDFGADDAEVLAHLLVYADPGLAARLKGSSGIGAYVYDWSINDGMGKGR